MKMKTTLNAIIFLCVTQFISCNSEQQGQSHVEIKEEPTLKENWWQIAAVPDLGEYNNDKMEPVDFAIWQAEDDTWQLVSCIRYCGENGDFRVLHRWEGQELTDTLWQPKGIFMMADSTLGEEHGWIQAPYVVQQNNVYKFFYGGGGQICLAEGTDGKHFQRQIQANGKTSIFEGEEYDRARDIMIMNYDNEYYGYYTGSIINSWPEDTKGAVFCRKSKDLKQWGEEVKVSETEENVVDFLSSECPQVIHRNGFFYLFKTQEYKPGEQRTTVFRSDNPLNFGIGTDSLKVKTLPISAPELFTYNGKHYMAALMPDLKGIRISELNWEGI
ncbi:hypothetical protein [Chondrinema litorale]|uniref:hypothetical protein n=1 Tax=Chondrinema litorale TaxID=2994555 RepID=UPI002543792C|nr:hypothetical protein [Chondrinema litorale]UZR99054.1 hypothetical protein OQ292_34845 [Chondrinema litorale]